MAVLPLSPRTGISPKPNSVMSANISEQLQLLESWNGAVSGIRMKSSFHHVFAGVSSQGPSCHSKGEDEMSPLALTPSPGWEEAGESRDRLM